MPDSRLELMDQEKAINSKRAKLEAARSFCLKRPIPDLPDIVTCRLTIDMQMRAKWHSLQFQNANMKLFLFKHREESSSHRPRFVQTPSRMSMMKFVIMVLLQLSPYMEKKRRILENIGGLLIMDGSSVLQVALQEVVPDLLPRKFQKYYVRSDIKCIRQKRKRMKQ